MNKLIFTKLRGRTVSVLASENRILQMEFEGEEAAEQIGTIYIGKVRNVVKNLNAAFVEYKPGVNGYYSLNDNPVHLFADGSCSDRALKSGDEILMQIERAAVKTKDAVLTGELNLTGRYAAVTTNGAKFGISAKIKDKVWRKEFKTRWEESVVSAESLACAEAAQDSNGALLEKAALAAKTVLNCGVIIRTNAYNVPFDDVLSDVVKLDAQMTKIRRDAAFRTPHTVLYRPDSFAVSAVRDLRTNDTAEVVTDVPEIYEELNAHGMPDSLALRFYEDSYPLSALYHLESSLDRALGKNVWLKSGGYLVIEPTEAMTVIDVNTGKNVDKKSPEETYFKTNMEAAAEIAVQLRLRNLSGIIIVDFIDMTENEHNEELLSTFRRYLAADPVNTTLVDMTALGLVEVTRKKIKRPLHEQVR